jgi:hypothetical protein
MATNWQLGTDLAAIPIPPLIQRIRTIVSRTTHTVYTPEELYGPIGQQEILRPALKALKPDLRNKALAYACLMNRLNYQREALRDPAAADILRTRADVCEWLARVAVEAHRTSLADLVDALTFDFSPRQGATSNGRARPASTRSTSPTQPPAPVTRPTGPLHRRRASALVPGYNTGVRSPLTHINTRSPRISASSAPSTPLMSPLLLRDHTAWNETGLESRELPGAALPDGPLSRPGPAGERAMSTRHQLQPGIPLPMGRTTSDIRPLMSVTNIPPVGTPPQMNANYGSIQPFPYDEISEEESDDDHMFENESEYEDSKSRASALEVAILSDAKRFCTSPAVQRVVDRVWRGDVVFYASLIDEDGISLNGRPSTRSKLTRARTVVNVRRGRPRGLRDVLRVSRLRVPRYQNLLYVSIYIMYLAIYAHVLMEHSISFTWEEIVLYILTIGYGLDELSQIYKCGLVFYTQYLWNPLDSLVLLSVFLFGLLRVCACVYEEARWTPLAYGILACNSVALWPRLLIVFDRYRWAGRRMAMLRRVFRRTLIVIIPIPFIFAGFVHAFYALSNGQHSIGEIVWTLFRVATGSPDVGFERAAIYHPYLGNWLMLIYILICVYSISAILLAVCVHAYTDSAPRSDREYRFRYTVRVLQHVKSETLFFYVPPLNLLHIPLLPAQLLLSERHYMRLNRFILRLLFWLPLLMIFVYERMWRRRWTVFGGPSFGGGVEKDDWFMVTDEACGRLPTQSEEEEEYPTPQSPLRSQCRSHVESEETRQLREQIRELRANCDRLESKVDQLLEHIRELHHSPHSSTH